jgi:hypothetical protein
MLSESKCFLSLCIDAIEQDTEVPVVLGIAVRPTLLQVMQGYVATAIVAIVGKIVSNITNN